MEFKIYFNDLNAQAQKDLLLFFNIKDPSEMNWDIYPVSVVYSDEGDDE